MALAAVTANVCEPQTLSDNSDDRARLGAVYTPKTLADWVAKLACEFAPEGGLRVLDLGCGEGALLSAFALTEPSALLSGVDTNAVAVQKAKHALPKSAQLVVEDVLSPAFLSSRSLRDSWLECLGEAPNVVFMNPPWGAVSSLTRSAARTSGLTLGTGQYDTYDVFCELALQMLATDGAYAFILPDSLFLPEHGPLRSLLATETRMEIIARLGEGVFHNVYRGCVIVVGRKSRADPDHMVECLRITKATRDRIDSAQSLNDARRKLSHSVLQSRFTADEHHRFDIDVSDKDGAVFKIGNQRGEWTDYLVSSRGAEISKHGRVLVCSACGTARPLPREENARCLSCNSELDAAAVQTIVRTGDVVDDPLWAPFIVGEDVGRYSVRSRRSIKRNVRGINYKQAVPAGEMRILVRKTGVGLHASLDTTGAVTNQVVFDYRLKPRLRLPFSYLHYVLGVLSSRVMFAYHLKRGGEIEWRSHPYVTQKTLATLPIPVPIEGTATWQQAQAIAECVERHLTTQSDDLEIESLVAGLFDLSDEDLRWAANVIATAADLEPMRRLRTADISRVQSKRVA
jgi:adenine-specific DNA-methyltransferase